jgi:hypothetical protein
MGNENAMEKTSEVRTIEEPKFTISEIRNYLQSQDSYGDIFYYLSAENIIKANQKQEEDEN